MIKETKKAHGSSDVNLVVISQHMVIIAHISDLHFPYTTEKLRAGLLEAIWRAQPTLVVVSGDLTQRGREKQYAASQQFLEDLPKPQLIVPGNHDVPLFDLVRRVFMPTERFQRYICDELMPEYSDNHVNVLGVNSTRAFTCDPFGFWKNGTLSLTQLDEIRHHFNNVPDTSLRVLVMHHPLTNPWNEGGRDTARHREQILDVLEEQNIDVVLSGHLHINFVKEAPLTTLAGRRVLTIQAGTACSTRLRDEPNAFNLLSWDGQNLEVKTMRWVDTQFAEQLAQTYHFPRRR